MGKNQPIRLSSMLGQIFGGRATNWCRDIWSGIIISAGNGEIFSSVFPPTQVWTKQTVWGNLPEVFPWGLSNLWETRSTGGIKDQKEIVILCLKDNNGKVRVSMNWFWSRGWPGWWLPWFNRSSNDPWRGSVSWSWSSRWVSVVSPRGGVGCQD